MKLTHICNSNKTSVKYVLWIIALSSFYACHTSQKMVTSSWKTMKEMPRQSYICHYIEDNITIDGEIAETAWDKAPWSASFTDIEGPSKPKPYYNTQMKMLWNDDYLFIAAKLEEEHIWGYTVQKNVPIYKFGNDFEVFIDPDRDHHEYYELEFNVLNTIWELTLEKPYRDGGPAIDPTNLPGLKTAVAHQGTVNDPKDIDQSWTVEIAIPFIDLHKYRDGKVFKDLAPMQGSQWAINFSRVHWEYEVKNGKYSIAPDHSEYNWVWSPQGIVNMHAPENWGILQFVKDGSLPSFKAKDQKARDFLMSLYHTQSTVYQNKQNYISRIKKLERTNLKMGGSSRPDFIKSVDFESIGAIFNISIEYPDESGNLKKMMLDQDSKLSEIEEQ